MLWASGNACLGSEVNPFHQREKGKQCVTEEKLPQDGGCVVAETDEHPGPPQRMRTLGVPGGSGDTGVPGAEAHRWAQAQSGSPSVTFFFTPVTLKPGGLVKTQTTFLIRKVWGGAEKGHF